MLPWGLLPSYFGQLSLSHAFWNRSIFWVYPVHGSLGKAQLVWLRTGASKLSPPCSSLFACLLPRAAGATACSEVSRGQSSRRAEVRRSTELYLTLLLLVLVLSTEISARVIEAVPSGATVSQLWRVWFVSRGLAEKNVWLCSGWLGTTVSPSVPFGRLMLASLHFRLCSICVNTRSVRLLERDLLCCCGKCVSWLSWVCVGTQHLCSFVLFIAFPWTKLTLGLCHNW